MRPSDGHLVRIPHGLYRNDDHREDASLGTISELSKGQKWIESDFSSINFNSNGAFQ